MIEIGIMRPMKIAKAKVMVASGNALPRYLGNSMISLYFDNLSFSPFLQQIGVDFVTQLKLPLDADEFPLPLREFIDFSIQKADPSPDLIQLNMCIADTVADVLRNAGFKIFNG